MNRIHRSSSGCHIAHGDVAPETIVRNTIGDSRNTVLLLPMGACRRLWALAIRQWGGHRRSCGGSLLWMVVVWVIARPRGMVVLPRCRVLAWRRHGMSSLWRFGVVRWAWLVTVAAVRKGGRVDEGRRWRRRVVVVVVVMRVVRAIAKQTFVLCLFGKKCATNKQHLPNNRIPLHSIAFHSCEFRGTFRSQFRNPVILPE
jgi:hypothetical protein